MLHKEPHIRRIRRSLLLDLDGDTLREAALEIPPSAEHHAKGAPPYSLSDAKEALKVEVPARL